MYSRRTLIVVVVILLLVAVLVVAIVVVASQLRHSWIRDSKTRDSRALRDDERRPNPFVFVLIALYKLAVRSGEKGHD